MLIFLGMGAILLWNVIHFIKGYVDKIFLVCSSINNPLRSKYPCIYP